MKVLWDALTPCETRLSTGQKLLPFLCFIRNNTLMNEDVVGGLRITSSFRVGFLFIKIQKSCQIKQNYALLHTEWQTTFANKATAHICTGPALPGSAGNSTSDFWWPRTSNMQLLPNNCVLRKLGNLALKSFYYCFIVFKQGRAFSNGILFLLFSIKKWFSLN